MNATLFVLLLLSVVGFAVGQLMLKSAMSPADPAHTSRRMFVARFASGIAAMALSFFVSLGLLQRFDLSYVYPFQGLNVLIIALGSAVFLREKLTLRLGVALLVIALGVALVSTS